MLSLYLELHANISTKTGGTAVTAIKQQIKKALEANATKVALYGLLFVGVVSYSFFRVLGNLPDVMSDELIYSSAARHQAWSTVGIPDYFYYWVYSSTNACGIGFYACSQALNVSFSLAAGALLFSVATKYSPRWIALLVALWFVLGPMAAYNSYFMPESMYFFFFMLVIWQLTRATEQTGLKFWGLTGALVGLLSLVKPHGLFLVPAIATYIVFINWRKTSRWIVRILIDLVSLGVSVIATKFSLGLIFAGPSGLSFFGSYSGTLTSTLGTSASTVATEGISHAVTSTNPIAFIFGQIGVQVIAVCFVAAVPIVSVIATGVRRESMDGPTNDLRKFSSLLGFLFIWMIPIIAVFSNTIRLAGEDSANRIMLRYYEFLIPLALVAAAGMAGRLKASGAVWQRWLYATAIGALAITGYAYIQAAGYNLQFVDSAFLKVWLGAKYVEPTTGSTTYWLAILVLVLSLLSLVIWAAKPSIGVIGWIAVSMPILVIASSISLSQNPVWRSTSTLAADSAGMFVRDMIPKDEFKNLLVIGTVSGNKAELVAKFHLDSPDIQTDAVDDGSVYSAANRHTAVKWELALGDIRLTDPGYILVKTGGIQLLRRDDHRIGIFDNDSYSSKLVSATEGLGRSSGQGLCATQTLVKLHLASALPANAKLRLGINGSPANANQQIQMNVGDWTQNISVGDPNRPIDATISAANTTPSNIVQFALPNEPGANMCLSYIEILK